jgi:DNA repair protein RadC
MSSLNPQSIERSPKRKRMKDFPLADRPRERMLMKSAKHLSEAELVAILLGTGSAKQNVLALSQSIMRQFPQKLLLKVALQDLVKIPGVGKSKAARILAALELGERLYAPSSLTKVTITSTEELLPHVRDIAGKKQEYLLALYLSTRNELLQKEVVGVGSLNSMLITPKEIFHHALTSPCASIIVVHNHPSGDPTPSEDDIHFTRRIHEAGEVMSIPLIDHVIVSTSGYFSFRENKVGK